MRSRKLHLQGTHTRKNRCYTTIYINFSYDLFHFLAAGFFELLAFFVALLRAFFAAGAALLAVLDDGFEAVAVDVVEAALVGLDFAALLLPAAFFFGDAAFFFGLLALPADFGLVAFDFGLADLAFFAPVDAFFLLAVAAGAGAAAVVVDAVAGALVAAAAVVVAGFFTAFFGEAERFRLVPVADFGLLDERAFFALGAPGVADRLRDLPDEARLAVDFVRVPAAEPLAFDDFACFTTT